MSMDRELDIEMEKVRIKIEAPTYSYRVDVVNGFGSHRTVQTITSKTPLTPQQAWDDGEKHCDFGKAVVVHDDPHALTWGPTHKGRVRAVVLFCKQDERTFGYLDEGWSE
jgi:hypothetical protein